MTGKVLQMQMHTVKPVTVYSMLKCEKVAVINAQWRYCVK